MNGSYYFFSSYRSNGFLRERGQVTSKLRVRRKGRVFKTLQSRYCKEVYFSDHHIEIRPLEDIPFWIDTIAQAQRFPNVVGGDPFLVSRIATKRSHTGEVLNHLSITDLNRHSKYTGSVKRPCKYFGYKIQ